MENYLKKSCWSKQQIRTKWWWLLLLKTSILIWECILWIQTLDTRRALLVIFTNELRNNYFSQSSLNFKMKVGTPREKRTQRTYKRGYHTKSSQVVSNPSTTLALQPFNFRDRTGTGSLTGEWWYPLWRSHRLVMNEK